MARGDLFLTASETKQTALLFYESERSAQRGLFELRSSGLIHTFAWRAGRARESGRHYMSALGARLVARRLRVDVHSLGKLPQNQRHAEELMPHRSGVNAFFCGIVASTVERPGWGLESWIDERQVRTPFSTVQPDGLGRLRHPAGATEFYFEYDLSTEHRKALVTKFVSYLRVASNWEQPDGHPFPSALFVVPGDHRELDLLQLLFRAIRAWDAAKAGTARLPFYCSTVSRVRGAKHLGPAWRHMLERPAKRLRLDELPTIDANGYDVADCLGRRAGADG
jgi:hypothetical protein